jgi:hypothetical protein
MHAPQPPPDTHSTPKISPMPIGRAARPSRVSGGGPSRRVARWAGRTTTLNSPAPSVTAKEIEQADHRRHATDSDDFRHSEPRREKRHRPLPQPLTLGVTASMQALKLLREGGRVRRRDGAGKV